ncbi:hypothetical protein CR513_60202, partial [Mucuna pruriens]
MAAEDIYPISAKAWAGPDRYPRNLLLASRVERVTFSGIRDKLSMLQGAYNLVGAQSWLSRIERSFKTWRA